MIRRRKGWRTEEENINERRRKETVGKGKRRGKEEIVTGGKYK